MDHRAARWFGSYLVLSVMLLGVIAIVLCAWWIDRPLLAMPQREVRFPEPVREIVLADRVPRREAHVPRASDSVDDEVVMTRPLLRIMGEVVQQDGLPLVGARVEAAAEWCGDVAFTNARGEFTVAVLEPTCRVERMVTLTMTMPGFADARIELPLGDPPFVQVTLERGVRVAGTVGVADRPLVLFRRSSAASAPTPLAFLAATRSRADGSFAFEAVPAGTDMVLAAAGERHALTILLTFDAIGDVTNVSVPGSVGGVSVPCNLVLDVRDAASNAAMRLEYVTVILDGERRGAITDASGHLEVACCEGQHAVVVERPGYESWQALCNVAAGAATVRLTATKWKKRP